MQIFDQEIVYYGEERICHQRYFAMPVYSDKGELERYNVFHVSLIVRHSEDGKMYLYDIIDIKKETGNPLEP